MFVGHDVLGSITASGQTKGLTLGNLRVGGAIRDGALTIDGNAGNIITNFGLGTDTGSLTVNGNVNLLSVGATHTRSDSAPAAEPARHRPDEHADGLRAP